MVKIAKLTKIRPNQLYILLGLVTVIVVALGLGTSREGFDSISNARSVLTQIVDNMNGAINVVTWQNDADKKTFTDNVNYLFNRKMLYLQQGGVDLNTFDVNQNNQLYKLNPDNYKTLDASGNALNASGVIIPRYVDDVSQPTPQFLQQYTLIDIKTSIKKEQLNVLRTQIVNRINNFSSSDPNGQKTLNDAFNALLSYGDQLGAFLTSNPNSTNVPSFANILSNGTIAPARNTATIISTQSISTPSISTPSIRTPSISTSTTRTSSGTLSGGTTYNPNYIPSVATPNALTNTDGVGISKSDIPPGSSDLYLLKTQVVPPTNPPGANPPPDGFNSTNPSPTQTCIKPAPVPPCPPCERCPEPEFDCKRVPKYDSTPQNRYLPQPVLADFSQFGM